MPKNKTPVWVNGTIIKETTRDITLRAIDRNGRQRDVCLPRVHLLGNQYPYLQVPQWWAHQNKLNHEPDARFILDEVTEFKPVSPELVDKWYKQAIVPRINQPKDSQ